MDDSLTMGYRKPAEEGGAFLTPHGFQRLREVFGRYRERTLDREPWDNSFEEFFSCDWPSFDNVYIALYLTNLLAKREITKPRDMPNGSCGKKSLAPRAHLTFQFDIQFPKVDREWSFERTLLNEFDVADVVKLKQALKALIDYPLQPETASFGSLTIGFAVLASPIRKGEEPTAPLPGLSNTFIASHPSWKRLKSRYRIRGVELKPA